MNRENDDKKLFCLTLDLENDWYFDKSGFDHLTFEYLDESIQLLREIDVPLSIFVVGKTLEKYPNGIRRLQTELDCEFHLHSYQHDTSKQYDFREEIHNGIAAFVDFFDCTPIGYRAPQGNINRSELRILEEEGFKFDSSIFPSYRPGIYNNITAPLEPYVPEATSQLYEIPVGTFPGIRLPISQSYFQLFGKPLSTYLSVSPLPDPLIYNFHLQDLYKTESHEQLDQPKKWIMKRNIRNSEAILKENVSTILERGYKATKISDVVEAYTHSGFLKSEASADMGAD